jgi:hypothetical protein
MGQAPPEGPLGRSNDRRSRRKAISAAERGRNARWAAAQKRPCSLLAREISEAEPTPPNGFGSPAYPLPPEDCAEIVKRATDAVRKAKRNGGKVYGAHLAKSLSKLIVMSDEDKEWLAQWVNYLGFWPQIVINDKYRSGNGILAALSQPLFAASRSTPQPSHLKPMAPPPPPPPLQAPAMIHPAVSVTPESESSKDEADKRLATLNKQAIEDAKPIPAAVDDPVIQSNIFPLGDTSFEADASAPNDSSSLLLPPTPRDMPFKFTSLSNDKAKAFCRAYWTQNDEAQVHGKALALVFDRSGINEILNHSTPARTFLIDTMSKLGIPLP